MLPDFSSATSVTDGLPRDTLIGRLNIDGRKLRIILGSLWILDSILQMQPKMFGSSFISMVIGPNAQGQPHFISSSITGMASFLSHYVVLWNSVFAITQLAIGLGIIFKKTTKSALILSFLWSFGVWWFGEGFGGILRGDTSALMGAPGAVVLYAFLGVLLWPCAKNTDDNRKHGIESSSASQGPLSAVGGLWFWAALWTFFAILQLLPDNRSSNWLHDSIGGMALGEPNWYANILKSLANLFSGLGLQSSLILASLFLLVGIGPFISRKPSKFIIGGAFLSLVFWAVGEAFGMILTGMGTDLNTGPLIILLAVAYLPTKTLESKSEVLVSSAFTRKPKWAAVGLMGLILIPTSVSVLPVQAFASTSSPHDMSGMVMAGTSVITPYHSKMNMAGMAGLGVTTTNWKYVGPPLPQYEVSILNTVSNDTDHGHKMQTPNCMTPPTASQVLGAVEYVQTTSAAVAKYKNLSAAVADGYIPITSTIYPVVHYINLKYMNKQDLLNPTHIDSLVYAFTPYGPVLVAAMYLMPGRGSGPMPYGCLVQWHAHTNLCYSNTNFQISGFLPCPFGTHYDGPTPMMTHVWQVPVPGGPLAIDPSDLQVVQAAIMAQEQGLAPAANPIPVKYTSQVVSSQ